MSILPETVVIGIPPASPEVYLKEIEDIKWTSVRCGVNPCAGESVKDAIRVQLRYSSGGAKERQKEHWTVQRTDCAGWVGTGS